MDLYPSKRTQILVFSMALFYLLTLFAPKATAQSHVEEGYITTDIAWSLSGSPYVIAGNLTVRNNATLTIEPGVVVKFSKESGLIIGKNGTDYDRGTLIAKGNTTQKITFTSNAEGPAFGDWNGIKFRISEGSILNNTVIEYADTAIELSNIFSQDPVITENTISKNNRGIRAVQRRTP